MAHETTLYSVLRIPENASSEDIKQAYRRLVKLWHPDLHPDDMSAEKRMQEITEAYTVLSDPAKKTKYDNSLSQKRAKQREQEQKAAKAAEAAKAAAEAKAAVRKTPPKDPDRAPDNWAYRESSYVDFTGPYSSPESYTPNSPFVVSDYRPESSVRRSSHSSSSASPSVSKKRAVEKLTPAERRMEDLTVALCVLFPVLIPIVYKHLKGSLEVYPDSPHYQDSLLSLKIVAAFAIPLWVLLIILIVKGLTGI